MGGVTIQGLHPSEYEHPFDKTALEVLRKIPLVPKLMEMISAPMNSITRLELLASNVKCNERQFPTIYRMLREACEILDVDEPLLYISSEQEINSYTACSDKPIICINSPLLDMLDGDELMFVIGHELAHIKSRHLVYQALGGLLAENMLVAIMSTVPGLGAFGQTATIALDYAYFEWSRMSEHTCDRGGYLACQNFTASCKALMKLAGYSGRYLDELNLDEFIRQGQEFKGLDSSAFGVVQKILISFGQSHPWTVSRVSELIKFNESGQYADVLERRTKRKVEDSVSVVAAESAENHGVLTGATIKNAAKGAISGFAKGLLKFTGESGSDDKK